jgi:acido-empty-quinoprotein group A
MNTRIVLLVVLSWLTAFGQGLDPALLLTQPVDTWPTYNGDYSGRRYSTLKQITAANIKNLALQWVYRTNATIQPTTIVGGEGDAFDTASFGPAAIKAMPLMVNGVLYFTVPDHAWAVDARTGRELWHYAWKCRGGHHNGNRGMAMYGNWLFFETPDNYLVSLDARSGKERWHIEFADVKRIYYSSSAPVIVGNHVIVGVGGDALDLPGFLEARDPETGALQWRWWTTPRKGAPEMTTWPDEDSSSHGGGMTWAPGTYDPESNLYYVGTGNPNPVHAAQSRKGDNLWTCSIVALNPDTGKLVWYYQVSPHDTHDWDDVETPVLFDGTFQGRPRKLVAQAARNGYFFVLDRLTGEHLITAPLIDSLNWTLGINAKGQPIPNPAKEPQVDGALVSPSSSGAINWSPPSFSPDTGLFYVSATTSFSAYYKTDTDDHPEGYGGRDSGLGVPREALIAVDYKTGKIAWRHPWPGPGDGAGGLAFTGLLSTAGNLLFTNDPSGNLVGLDPSTGRVIWHTRLNFATGNGLTNGPETYLLDGRQYLLWPAGDSIYAFALNE